MAHSSNAKEPLLRNYGDKSTNEIDMVIEHNGVLYPLKIRRSVNPGSELIHAFSRLDKAFVPQKSDTLLCMRSKLSAINF